MYCSSICSIITNCSFHDSIASSDGGSLLVSSSANSSIENCEFKDSVGSTGGTLHITTPRTIIKNSSFLNSRSSNRGGTAYVSANLLSIVSESNFMNSLGWIGGTLSIISPLVELNNNSFKNSSSTNNGGTAYISSSTNSSISNCEFLDSRGSAGGTLWISSSQVVDMKNNSFKNSSSTSDGGTAYISSSTNSSISNCEFIDSRGLSGGTLWISSQVIDMKNCSFKNSISTSNGGTACISSSTNSTISNCTYIDSIGNSGGTLWITSPSIDMKNNTFINSISSSAGGSHYLNCSNSKYNQIWFKNISSGTTGGATHIESSTNGGLFHFSDCFFGECRSSTNGGAIYINFRLNDITEVYSCTFYSCISGQEGGALCFVNSNRGSYACDLKRICISECSTSSTTTSHRGSAFLIVSHTQNHMISLSMVTASSCGTLGKGTGTFYVYYGQQKGDGLNISYCSSFLGSGFYCLPYFAANYEFNNFVNCTSSSSYCIYCQLAQPSSYSFDITRSNFLNISSTEFIFLVNISSSNKWNLRYSVLYGNLAPVLFRSQTTHSHEVQYCFIVHTGSYTSTIQLLLCVTTQSTSVLTPTHALSHYSTNLCQVPNDQEPLEIPCQTIPEELIPPECPPIPSTCNIPSDGGSLYFSLVSTIFHIITTSLVNLL